jgi:MFS transporter, PAT family, beta-lactamase induction signal transducer AmpG
VTALSVSSGLPLGLIVTAIPAWLTVVNVDIKTVGLLTLVQLPYGFKFVWAPLLDTWRPPWFKLRRGWMFLCQLAIALGFFGLSYAAFRIPDAAPQTAASAPDWLISAVAALGLLISFASASFDIAYDAYAVEVLEKHEHGPAVGARSAAYRAGMWLSGSIAISLSPFIGWSGTLLMQGVVVLLLVGVTFFAPDAPTEPTTKTLRQAVWQPFVEFLSRPRALEIAAFVLLYRLADSIAGALVSPFLLEKHFSTFDVGVVRGLVGIWGTILGTFAGSILAAKTGVGRALWICGVLQIVSNLGYAVVASINPSFGQLSVTDGISINLALQLAILVETTAGGMGWGAFGVLLLRLTDKRFSATQYALFSSLVGLARSFVGPPAGVLADALGWRDFFILTMAFGIPGLVMLQRFVPWGEDPKEISGASVDPIPPGPPYSAQALALRALASAAACAAFFLCLSSFLVAIKKWRAEKIFDFASGLHTVLSPTKLTEAVDVMNALVFGLVAGLAVAAYLAARGKRTSS